MPDNKIAEAYVEISAKTSGFQNKLSAVHSKLQKLSRNFEAISKVGKIAFAGLSGAMAYIVDQSIHAQDAADNLSVALGVQVQRLSAAAVAAGKAGMSTAQQSQKVKQLTSGLRRMDDALQSSTTYSRRQIESLQATALASGIAQNQMGTFTQTVIGLSAATGGNLVSSMHQLQYAMSGNFGELSRMFPMLKTYKTQQEKMNYIIQIAAGGMKMAHASANTFAGSLVVLKNKLGTAAASLGKQLLPDLTALVKWLTAGVAWFSKLSPATKKWAVILTLVATVVAGLLASLPILITIVGSVSTVIAAVTTATEFLTAAFATFDVATGGIVIAIGALITAIILLITHWQECSASVKSIGKNMLASVTFIFSSIEDVFTGNINGIISKFEKLKSYVLSIWNWISGKKQAISNKAHSIASAHPDAPGSKAINNDSDFNHALTTYAAPAKSKHETKHKVKPNHFLMDVSKSLHAFLSGSEKALKKYHEQQLKAAKTAEEKKHKLEVESAKKAKHLAAEKHKKELEAEKKAHKQKVEHARKLAHQHISSMSLSQAFEKNMLGNLTGKSSVPHQQLTEAKTQTKIMLEHLQVSKKILAGVPQIGTLA